LFAVIGIAVAATAAMTSCGIPQYVFLAPPVLSVVTELPPVATLTHDAENDTDSFAGYELYYKFYDPDADYTVTFAQDRMAIENAGPTQVVSTLDTRGFYRIYRNASGSSPTIEISSLERTGSFAIQIAFAPSPADADDGVATWDVVGPQTTILLRDQNALGNPVTALGFSPADIVPSSDPDMPESIAPTGNVIRMAIVAFAYGTDFVTGTFANVYSEPSITDRTLAISFQ
jgi:hypothetical protein